MFLLFPHEPVNFVEADKAYYQHDSAQQDKVIVSYPVA